MKRLTGVQERTSQCYHGGAHRLTLALERRRLRRLAAGKWVGHPEHVGRRTWRAWSAGCACGAARHVSKLER